VTEPKPLKYSAAVVSIETGEEQNVATFYIMNTSENRNRWAVTDKALEDAMAGLLGKPLGLGEGYREGHFADTVDVGRFIAVDKPNGYALARAEITDPVAWANLSAGEWGPISVVIQSYGETCSLCGEELTGMANPWEHPHVAQGDGHILVNSFKFDRVDFVPDPAYPQAGMINFGAETPVTNIPLTLCAAYYEGRTQIAAMTEEEIKARIQVIQGRIEETYQVTETDPELETLWIEKRALEEALIERIRARINASHSIGGAPGSPLNPEEKRKKIRMEEELKRLQAELDTVKAELTSAVTKITELTDSVSNYGELKAQVDAGAVKRHADLLGKVADMRFKAKLCDDRDAEEERLKEKSEEYLAELLVDAAGVAAGIATAPPAAPLTQYTPDAVTGLDASIEEMRATMAGSHSFRAEAS